jgi:hypothetical protein
VFAVQQQKSELTFEVLAGMGCGCCRRCLACQLVLSAGRRVHNAENGARRVASEMCSPTTKHGQATHTKHKQSSRKASFMGTGSLVADCANPNASSECSATRRLLLHGDGFDFS